MTEDQAKTKWCPLAQIAQNVFQQSGEIQTCAASNCMMWRIIEGMPAFDGEGDGILWIKEHRRIYGSSLKDAVEAKRSGKPIPGLGYCGLGGRP